MNKTYRVQTKDIIILALVMVAIVGFNTNAWTDDQHCDATHYSSWQDSHPDCSAICGDVDKTDLCNSTFGSCASAAYLHHYDEQENDDGEYRCVCLIACNVEDCELESCP